MKPVPHIRAYRITDQEACIHCFTTNVPDFFTQDEIQEFTTFLENYVTQFNNPTDQRKTCFFVVEADNKIVGCGGFGDKNGNQIISLAWGHIHKDYHKHGLGKALLLFRLKEIKKIFPALPVIIDTTQFSYGFYEKNGFNTVQVIPDFYTVGMHKYEMKWTPNK
jgi:N-acetylglutamate synthase-like GNAT family acetyltransferase